MAQTIALETGAIARCPTVGNSAAYCRGVDTTTISNGKRTGKGNGKNGHPYLAWASMEAAQFTLRFHPEVQRLYQRKLAKSQHNTIIARKSVAQKLSRASDYLMRDLVPFDVNRALGSRLASRWVEAGGWGKRWVTTTLSDESRSQPVTDGLPPDGEVWRRLCREPLKSWTREGAMISVRCTRLDTAGNQGFSGAHKCQGQMSGEHARYQYALILMGDWCGALQPTPRY